MPNKFWLYIRLSIKEFWLKQEINEAQGLKSRTSVLNKQTGSLEETIRLLSQSTKPGVKARGAALVSLPCDGGQQLVSYKTTRLVFVMETFHHGDPVLKSWKVN